MLILQFSSSENRTELQKNNSTLSAEQFFPHKEVEQMQKHPFHAN